MKMIMDWFIKWLPYVWAVLATFCITAYLFAGAIWVVLWIISLLGGM